MRFFDYFLILAIAIALNSCKRTIPGKVDSTLKPEGEEIVRPHLVIDEENVPEPEILSTLVKQMMDTIQIDQYFPSRYVDEQIEEAFTRFYSDRNYQVAWYNYKEPVPKVEELFTLLENSWQHGLNTDDYQLEMLKEAYDAAYDFDQIVFAADLVKADFLFTSAYLIYANHLHAGRIDPENVMARWVSYFEPRNLSEVMQEALNSNSLSSYSDTLLPGHQQYAALQKHLIKYVELEENGGWPDISAPSIMIDGNLNDALIRRLALSGDLDSTELGNLNEAVLIEALKVFQSRHQVDPSGQIDETTYQILSQPVGNLIDKIELNMERFRWYPQKYTGTYITVNVPEFVLRLFEEDRVEMAMKVIVGEEFEKHATPVFSDKMEYVVFSPTWNVPITIGRREFLPMLRKNPNHLADKNMVIYKNWDKNAPEVDPTEIEWADVTKEEFNYKIVQKPGGANALGGVKFIFPNSRSIYLHDTPADYLFGKEKRDLSHGCIRVDKPVDLAEYLLDDQPEWDYSKITEFMHKKEPEWVHLNEKVPVHIMYQTLWVNADNQLVLSKDLYEYDQKQIHYIKKIES